MKRNINEASSDFKGRKFIGKKSKMAFYWEYKMLPATVTMEFLFRIDFNRPAIDRVYKNPKTNTPHEIYDADRLFFNDYIRKNFIESVVRRQCQSINIPGFKCTIVTYKGEFNIYTLKVDSKKPQLFGYAVTVEATDPKKVYTTKEIIDMASKFIKPFETKVLKDTKFYKITI